MESLWHSPGAMTTAVDFGRFRLQIANRSESVRLKSAPGKVGTGFPIRRATMKELMRLSSLADYAVVMMAAAHGNGGAEQ